MSISKETYETVSKLILCSEWGRNVTNTELALYLMNEVNELIEGYNKQDYENILEESSDVLMILLYIIIKSSNNPKHNLIDEMLNRLNAKLKNRYSVFFNEDSDCEREEEHWIKTKHLEKEVSNYAFCPNAICSYYAKTGNVNIQVSDEMIKCTACGYTACPSNKNILFYRSKSRRKLFDNLEWHFDEYIKSGNEFADEFFFNSQRDYFKVIRLLLKNDTSSKALNEYITNKFSDKGQLFNIFLLSPLINYLDRIQYRKEKINSRTIIINDIMIKNINAHYHFLKEYICMSNNREYNCIWISYIQYLFLSMQGTVEYSNNYGIIEKDEIDLNFFKKSQLIMNYDIYVKLNNNMILTTLCNPADNNAESVLMMKSNINTCKTNTEIGMILFSIYLKFNLQSVSEIAIKLYGTERINNKNDLEQLLKDLMPNTGKITLL